MGLLLFVVVIALLLSSSDRGLREIGENLATGVAIGVLALFAVAVLLLGFAFFPTTTTVLLYVTAAVAVLLLVRWVYKRFFSKQAGINRAYKRMDRKWYAISEHVARMELDYYTNDLEWAVEKGQRLLKLCREEYERYKDLPPEPQSHRGEFYLQDIELMDSRLRKFSGKLAASGAAAFGENGTGAGS